MRPASRLFYVALLALVGVLAMVLAADQTTQEPPDTTWFSGPGDLTEVRP